MSLGSMHGQSGSNDVRVPKGNFSEGNSRKGLSEDLQELQGAKKLSGVGKQVSEKLNSFKTDPRDTFVIKGKKLF